MRTIFTFWLAASMAIAADVTLYVNTASTTGTQDCTTNTPGNSGTAACESLSKAESKIPADITGTGVYTIICSGSSADTTAASFNGTVTDATHYIVVTTTTDRHAGVWDDSKYRLVISNGTPIQIVNRYVRIDGLQVGKSSSSANLQAVVTVTAVASGGSDIRVSNSILKQAGNASFSEPGIYNNDADSTLTVYNTIILGVSAFASDASAAVYNATGVANIYNSTLIGGYRGIRAQTGTTVTSVNNYAYGSNAAYSASGTLNLTTSAANDTTASPDTLDSIALNTTNFTNVTAGSENFHLPAGSALLNVGTSDPGSGMFSTDIDAQARSGAWDVGADELVSAGRRRLVIVN